MIKKSILVVDDDNFNRQIIAEMLMKTGLYTVMSAAGGKMGCELAERFLPDIILMDWNMPGVSGYDALQQLKAHEKTKNIPVVMITGVVNQAAINEAMKSGVAEYIAKPVVENELLAKIKSLLEQ